MQNLLSLKYDPIVEAVMEIRFASSLPQEAVFGVFYRELGDLFDNNYVTLPAGQIPESIRKSDPNFKYAATHALIKNNYQFNIGAKVASLVVKKPYPGWIQYYDFAHKCFSKIIDAKTITSVSRFGLRYVNFFEFEILSELNLTIETPFEAHRTASNISLSYERNGFQSRVFFADNATHQISGKSNYGSVIDIDTFIESDFDFLSNMKLIMNDAHIEEKQLFFELLKEDLISKLGATYE